MRPSLRAGITFLISASSALCEQCTHDAFNGSTWVLDGCEALDLSCPPPDAISRAPACANALLPGEVAALAAALKGSSVTAIQLRGSPLGQSGAAALVPALTKLHTLGLGSCRVGDAGAKIIADDLDRLALWERPSGGRDRAKIITDDLDRLALREPPSGGGPPETQPGPPAWAPPADSRPPRPDRPGRPGPLRQ